LTADQKTLDKLLGPEPNNWPKHCPVEYPIELNRFETALVLIQALKISERSVQDAQKFVRTIDANAFKRFFIDVAQHSGSWRYRHWYGQSTTASLRRSPRSTPRRRELLQLFADDNYRCRYCGTPVVGDRKQFVAMASRLNMPELVLTGSNEVRHGLYLTYRASHDHRKPLSEGGSNNRENLLTACWPCQFGKYKYSCEDLGLTEPGMAYPALEDWSKVMRNL